MFSVSSQDKLCYRPQWNWGSMAMWEEGDCCGGAYLSLTKRGPEEFLLKAGLGCTVRLCFKTGGDVGEAG